MASYLVKEDSLTFLGKCIFLLQMNLFISYVSGNSHEGQRGPTFFSDPPSRVEFVNDTGAVVPCSAQGQPAPAVSWTQQDGHPLRDVPGVRQARPDGSLVFPPFAAEDFRQGVHDAVYRCVASNALGSIISREVHVKAIVKRRYKVQVYDEFVVRGNTAVLRCQVPSFVHEYITFLWKRGDGAPITSSITRGGRYSILPTGELYIRAVTQADGQKNYKCQTRHRLTGEIVASASAGSLFVTEPHGTSSPKIIDYRAVVSANEGETLELACAATAFPPPSYRWYKEEGRLVPLSSNHRISQLDGSLVVQFLSAQDSGRYVCVVNNSAGEDRATTMLTVLAPLSVYISPQRQTADVGRPATFNCSVQGRPVRSLVWTKDRRPVEEGGRALLLSRDVLHIPVVQREDRGMYQCFAFNDFESAQSTAELRLGDVAPVLLATFTADAVRPGSSVSLRCSASGNPLPQVTWYLDDISIPDVIRFRVGDYVTSDGHVMSYVNITDVHVEDGGEYTCSADNAVQKVKHSARLDVFGPPFVRSMPNVSVVAGRTAVLKCAVSGYPIEAIVWSKDGATLPTNHRQKVDTWGKLSIQDVQRSVDEGFYACEVTGPENKKAEGKMHMRVQVAPVIETVMMPEVLYAKEGTKTKVMCSVTQGDPPVQITWRKNGHSFPMEKDLTMQSLEDSSILIFRKISAKHTGNYTCFASNAAATVNRTTRIIVNVPPRWKVEPANSFAVVGKTVLMHCVAEGYPETSISWKKADGSLAKDFHPIHATYQRQVFDNGTLALREVTEADGGHYLCQATNGIGAGLSKVIHLTIHTPPKFEAKFVSHTVPKGKDAELICEAEGELPIRFEWEKDKQPLDAQSLKRLSAIEDTGPLSAISKLIVTGATRSDSALYTCTATNEFGSDQTNIQLVVQEPPSPPVELSVKEKNSRTVTLGWAPTFSGNSPVIKYTVQYGNSSSDENDLRLKDVSVSGSEISIVVRGLIPANSYKFRVLAENALGVSEPSDFITISTDEEVPGAPPLDVSVQPTGSQSLKVTWKAPRKDLQYGTIHGYYIGYKVADTDDQFQYKNVEATDGQELSYLTNLRRLTKYKVIVQAYNNIGAGPRSDEVSATTLEAAPPTSPLLTLHSVTSSSITVVWDRQLDDTGIREYIIHYKTEGGIDKWKEEKLSTSGNQYTLDGLRCGTGYRLYMTATNSLGMGEPSEIISARTKGAAPVSPQKDAFIRLNSTSVTLHFGAWSSGGCPINFYSVHFRFQGQWKVVAERVDATQAELDVRHLAPAREYTLRVSAHSDAGTTEAEYRFTTLNITIPYHVSKSYPAPLPDGLGIPFYKNLTVLLPVIISFVVLTIVIITVMVCLRRQVDTASMSEDGRKGRANEHMGLNEFPQKSLKDHDSYGGKSSYYSSPARKPLAMASSSQRGVPGDTSLTIKKYSEHIESNHEYAEPYCTVPAPRCIIDDDLPLSEDPIRTRPKSDGPYSTVKRSPSRGVSHFTDLGQVVDLRMVRPMSCMERQDLCNNSSSSQSGASGSDGYRQYRQGTGDKLQGPRFVQEPPRHRVDFSNGTGTVLTCAAHGVPQPRVAWMAAGRAVAADVPGLRHVRPDGSLVLLPFRAEEYRQDVHDAVYRCAATNAVGTVLSREAKVRGVVQQTYSVEVYDEFVIRGNTAVLKCIIPGLVQEYVTVTSWIRDESFVIRPTSLAGDRFSIFLTGELHIRRVDHDDGLQLYKCETRHRLTGETVRSSKAARVRVTESFRDVAPRITDSKRFLKVAEGETLEAPCAAQGTPVPAYEWFRKEARDRLTPVQIGGRILQLDGTLVLRDARVEDSALYVCKVRNNAGSDSKETEIMVLAPLSAQVLPKLQNVDVGKSATFNCSTSGHPVASVEWLKDGLPLRATSRVEFPSRDILRLASVQRADKGMFQCFVTNDFDSAQGTAQLSLGDYPPSLLETFADNTLEPGPSVTLKCVAQGNPLPQITWTLDSGVIPENPRFRLGDYVRTGGDAAEVVSYVNVTSVRPEDGGQYECTAANDVGKAVHSSRLNIFGPPFVRPMANVSVVAGDTMRLQCPVGGHPIESIRWEKDGVRLPLNHRQKVFQNGTLLVRNVEKASDTGPYKCSASNSDGISAENSLFVKVLVRPLIEPFAFPKSLQTGQRFSVLCTVTEGDPPIKIQWIKDNQHAFVSSAHDGVRSVVVTPFSTTLVFESLAPEHRGNYTCVASNAGGTVSHSAPMVIHVPPRWRIEPGDTSVTKSRSAVVDCQADGFPVPRIRWTKAEGDVASEFRPISSSSRLHVFENGSLVIHSVEEGDNGHYLCQATNGIGQGLSKVIRLSVHVAAHFKSKFRAESVRKGEDAKLVCEAIGDRPLQITWLKDKQAFEPQIDLRYELTETVLGGGTTSELTIRRADRRDSALYTCIASNSFGQDDTNMQLIMQEPPDAPQDVKVLEFGSRTAKLGWSSPYSGNSPISQYILHYKEEADRWQQKSWNITIPGTENNVVVRGLLPVTFYHFRLYADNALGRSEPSNVVHLRMDQEAPGGPPQKVKARAQGAHVVKVTWKPPRKDLQFGIIKGYYVGYKEGVSKDTFIYKTLNAKGGENFVEETLLTDLKKFTEYAVIVQGFNAKGAGPPSDQVMVKTLENDPPGGAVLKVAFANQSSIGVTWEQKETGNPVQGYILYHKWEMGEWSEKELSASEKEYAVHDLRCGSRYQFYITAFNEVGRGVPSEALRSNTEGRAPVAPDKQSMLTVNQTSAVVHLDAWHDGGCPLTSFAVRYRQQRQQGWNLVPDGDPLRRQVVLDDLVPGTWYRLQVTAHNAAGSTDAEYTFVTNPVNSDSPPTFPVSDDTAQELPLYLDINILVPAAVSLAVVIALVILVCVIMYKRNSQDTNQTGGSDSYGSSRKCQVHENVPMAEKSSLKKTLSGPVGRGDYYPTPYATTRLSAEEQKEAAARQAAMEEPLYATVKRTPRPPRSDFHVYHYPGEMPEFFIQASKSSCMDDIGASSSSVLWKESADSKLKDEYDEQLLADCNRSGGSRKSYRYAQR